MLVFSSLDQKPLQPISRSVEVIDLEEPHTSVLQVPPASEPLVQEDLQAQVHDAPVSVRTGEVSPLMIEMDSNEVDMRPEGEFISTIPNITHTCSSYNIFEAVPLNIVFSFSSFNRQHLLPICNW